MTVTFQLFGENDRWVGDADTIFDARRACEELVLVDGEVEARIEVDGTQLEEASLDESGTLTWRTSDLVRQYDGRVR